MEPVILCTNLWKTASPYNNKKCVKEKNLQRVSGFHFIFCPSSALARNPTSGRDLGTRSLFCRRFLPSVEAFHWKWAKRWSPKWCSSYTGRCRWERSVSVSFIYSFHSKVKHLPPVHISEEISLWEAPEDSSRFHRLSGRTLPLQSKPYCSSVGRYGWNATKSLSNEKYKGYQKALCLTSGEVILLSLTVFIIILLLYRYYFRGVAIFHPFDDKAIGPTGLVL